MFELPSAFFLMADGSEFRFARFYIVCEAIRLGALERPPIVCGLSDTLCGLSRRGKDRIGCQTRHGRNTQILLQRSALADTFETLCPLISYPVTHANQRLVWQRFSISYSFSIQRSSCASRSSYLQSPCLRQSHFPQFSIKKSMFIAARACLHISRYV